MFGGSGASNPAIFGTRGSPGLMSHEACPSVAFVSRLTACTFRDVGASETAGNSGCVATFVADVDAQPATAVASIRPQHTAVRVPVVEDPPWRAISADFIAL